MREGCEQLLVTLHTGILLAAFGSFLGMLSPAKLLALFIAKDDLSIPTGRAPLHRAP